MAFAQMAFACFFALALAGQQDRCSSSDDVCLIQLKSKDKHVDSYVEQIGSGSSGEVKQAAAAVSGWWPSPAPAPWSCPDICYQCDGNEKSYPTGENHKHVTSQTGFVATRDGFCGDFCYYCPSQKDTLNACNSQEHRGIIPKSGEDHIPRIFWKNGHFACQMSPDWRADCRKCTDPNPSPSPTPYATPAPTPPPTPPPTPTPTPAKPDEVMAKKKDSAVSCKGKIGKKGNKWLIKSDATAESCQLACLENKGCKYAQLVKQGMPSKWKCASFKKCKKTKKDAKMMLFKKITVPAGSNYDKIWRDQE